jgi:hypothetical protein
MIVSAGDIEGVNKHFLGAAFRAPKPQQQQWSGGHEC